MPMHFMFLNMTKSKSGINQTVHIFSKKPYIHTAIQSILALFFTELAEK